MARLAHLADDHDQTEFSATYDVVLNHLRIYTNAWLERALYDELVEAGFRSAPKQVGTFEHCFLCKRWTPLAEDVCLIMAGSIELEESTLEERAAARAARFDGYRMKRTAGMNAFHSRAQALSEGFANGQPILQGHHSEVKMRTAQKITQSAINNALDQQSKADYWAYRAESTERHANRQGDPRTRANRIRRLLKDLRVKQHTLNDYERIINTWEEVQATAGEATRAELVEQHLSGWHSIGFTHAKAKLESGEMTPDQIIIKALDVYRQAMSREGYTSRWINHILNRLGFETEELGTIHRFTGTLTPTILQKFCRVHGAEKPKATKSEGGFTVTSPVTLPLHIANGKTLTLSPDEWCDLMRDCGFSVEANTPRKTVRNTTPLLNIDAKQLTKQGYRGRGEPQTLEVVRMSKAEYMSHRAENRETALSACGQFKFRTVWVKSEGEMEYIGKRAPVYLTDSKTHPMPEAPQASE